MSASHNDSLLPFGAYETPVNARVRQRIELTKSELPLSGIYIADSNDEKAAAVYQTAISRGIARVLEQRLAALSDPAERLALINSITKVLGED